MAQDLFNLSAMQQDSHPYYPSTADVPGYHPPRLGPFAIGLIFAACSMAVVAIAWRVSGSMLITLYEGCSCSACTQTSSSAVNTSTNDVPL